MMALNRSTQAGMALLVSLIFLLLLSVIGLGAMQSATQQGARRAALRGWQRLVCQSITASCRNRAAQGRVAGADRLACVMGV